jgi:NAD(P)-dependent dehydrogenase (short-subunit alcohol dehydrogenase family)
MIGMLKRAFALVALVGMLVLAPSVNAATVLITGANSGVGLEFARQYAAAGWTVIATHRHDTTPDTLAALQKQYANVRPERMDVTSVDEMRALSEKLKDVPIDVLINNAAIYADRGDWSTQKFGNLDYALGETMLKTNILGPLFVAQSFMKQIAASAQKKIVSITSTHASLTKPIAGSSAIFYRASKAGLNRAMLAVADDLKPQGIIVVLVHPGSVRKSDQEPKTSVLGPRIDIDLTVGSMRKTIEALSIKDSGRFMLYDGTTLPW